ncbi:E3 ubiquitin-protein ligase Hel1p [Trichomonascus vanleenenianus]|uniref:E3 ubiquitin-protein ligase HEL1 n=1 Tax=Trichomonascus vanleenenianus TaxID=2268995 RepID=UPI003ECB8247
MSSDFDEDEFMEDGFDEDEYDSFGEDLEDQDMYEEDLKPAPKVYETSFTVLSPKDLEEKQHDMNARVANVTGLSELQAATLLSAYKWHEDSLVERFVENSDKVMASAGLPKTDVATRLHYRLAKPAPDFVCFICCDGPEDEPDMKTFALACGHTLCSRCYAYYVTQKIQQEAESRLIRCPGEKCPLRVDEAAVKLLVEPNVYARYEELTNEKFVEDSEFLAWCPAPNCGNAIRCQVRQSDLAFKVPSVRCKCGYAFCFGCRLTDHMPCSCALAKKWIKKCHDDSETSNWIAANTKDCPKCHSTIEKNGGCNHMTCKKCRYEFCWMCMGDWEAHGSSYYNCSRYDAKDAQEARNEQERSRAELERYLHFYNRYANHQQSLKLDTETFRRVQKKMKEMQEQSGMSWIEVQFLNQAFEVLQACRQTLTWTYAFAFYLKEGNITTIFQDNQRDLEMATEQLSEIFEQPATDIAEQKVHLLDKCRYVANRRVILLEDTARGLRDQTWEYNVSLD